MKKSCVIYDSWGELLTNLPDDMAGQLIKQIIAYAFDMTETTLDNPALNAMFAMIKTKLDEDAEAYDEIVKQRSEAGKRGMAKRWNNKTITKDNEVITNDNGVTDEITKITVSVSDSVSDKDIKEKEKKKTHFVKPTLEEVRSYCQERHNSVNPEAFVDFYESKGWKVGNQAMKDWKAAVRTWETRESIPANKSSPKSKTRNHLRRQYDFNEINEIVKGQVNDR